ncbi:MAG: translation initiation factor IF-1 [bacterium]|nr:translation initiation factor IF-1 [bacterium]
MTSNVQQPNNSSKNIIKVEGAVEEALPGTSFRVKTSDGKEVIAHLSGKMRMHYIKILPGDHVTMEMTPYDDRRGRIIRRM